MNIFVLFDVLDPHGPICSPKTSYLFIVSIPRSHVITHASVTKVSSHFKLQPDPIATTVNASYLHNHRLSQAQIWWRSRLVSWLQVAVLGLFGNDAQPEIFESQDTHSNSDSNRHWMLNNSTTTAPLTPFLFVDIALVRALPWLCSGSPTTLSSPRYSSHKVPWPVSPSGKTVGVRLPGACVIATSVCDSFGHGIPNDLTYIFQA